VIWVFSPQIYLHRTFHVTIDTYFIIKNGKNVCNNFSIFKNEILLKFLQIAFYING